jgi:polyisoprenoid-binding protein YceI
MTNLSRISEYLKRLVNKTILVFLATTLIHEVHAQTNSYLKSVKASVYGTSTLHDWESKVTTVEYKGSLQTEGNIIKTIKDVEVKIPVESIKSKEGEIMDHKTYEAFNSDKNPYIIFTFSSTKVIVDAMKTVNIEASGNLTMAGTTRPLTLIVQGKMLENGDLQLFFSKKINMKDFNMKPPEAVLGTIKVGDEVTVNFDMVLTPSGNNN